MVRIPWIEDFELVFYCFIVCILQSLHRLTVCETRLGSSGSTDNAPQKGEGIANPLDIAEMEALMFPENGDLGIHERVSLSLHSYDLFLA